MADTLAESYRYCQALAQREAGNFYPAFRILPREQRLAMCAVYAFSRIADDISDEPGAVADQRRQLEEWRQGLESALVGRFSHPIHEALAHTVHKYHIPSRYLHDILDGVAMDLEPLEIATFADLRAYCYRVASAVGLICVHIWGFAHASALAAAEDAGLAFQLTNILRDLKEDAERGRVYLPREDLERFGYTRADLEKGVRNDAFRNLMTFQAERARGLYESAQKLRPLLPPAGRAVYQIMSRTYRGLLEEIVRRDYDVFRARVRLSSAKKLWFLVQAVPTRLGWR